MRVPITGSSIPHDSNNMGGIISAPVPETASPTPEEVPFEQGALPPSPPTAPEPRIPIRSRSPRLGHMAQKPLTPTEPPEMEFLFFDKGPPRLVTKEVARQYYASQEIPDPFAPAETPAETPTEEPSAAFEVPAHPSAPAPTPTPAPADTSEIDALKKQIAEQNQIINAVLIAQAQGKPLAEVLGQPAKPAALVPPDPTQYDLYDAASAAEFQRQNQAYMQAMIERGVKEAVAPYSQSMEETKWLNQFNQVKMQYEKSDPAWEAKAEAAMRLILDDRNANGGHTRWTIPAAYKYIDSLKLNFQTPEPPAPAPAPAPAAQRTLTAEQAKQKAEQAARLPKTGNGVTGAARPGPPTHIKGLGTRLAYNIQHGRVGKQ